jgi:chitin synthase
MALRFQTNYDFTDVPIPTTRQPPPSGATIRRAKTLTKPERGVAPVPLINPPHLLPSSPGHQSPSPQVDYNGSTSWRIFSRIVTLWAPDFLLSSLGGLKDKAVRQAWREKVALCFIIGVLCCAVGFVTVGFQKVLCPENITSNNNFMRVGSVAGTLSVRGIIFNSTHAKSTPDVNFESLARVPGTDITQLFQREASQFKACTGINFRVARDPPCSTVTQCPLGPLNLTTTFSALSLIKTTFLAGYSWEQVAQMPNYFVLDGAVINLTPYLTLHKNAIQADNVDAAIRTIMTTHTSGSGKDATRLFYNRADLKSALPCIKERYYAGNIDKVTPGCFVSSLLLYAGLIIILSLVVVRFIMACVFNWFLSEHLAGPPNSQEFNRSAISPAVMPEGANISVDNKNGTAPWAGGMQKKLNKPNKVGRPIASSSSTTLINSESGAAPIMSLTQIGAELFAVCLVTCYSEGEESLRTTLDSISTTTYSDARKLLFIVADGMITGAGEKKSTPDICVSLLEADPRFGNPIPMSYAAVGSGAKAQNRAMVYAGHYSEFFFLQFLNRTQRTLSRGGSSDTHGHHRQMWYRCRVCFRQETRQSRETGQPTHSDELFLSRNLQRSHVASRLRPFPENPYPYGCYTRFF